MRSNFIRNTSSREKRITYTPMFTKTFIEKSPVKTKVEDSELLKAEKIKSFWELLSYEDYYKEKKSIKARVSDILQSTASLAEEVQSLNQSIRTDEDFIKQIQEVKNLQFRKRIKKNWGNHVGLAWVEFWLCFNQFERTFCAQILVNQTTSAVKVKVFALDSRDPITVKFGVDVGFKEILKDSEKVLNRFKENYLMKIGIKTKDEIANQEISGFERQVNIRRIGRNAGIECFDEDCEVGNFGGVVGGEEYAVRFYENYAVYLHMVKIWFRGKCFEFVSCDYKDEFDRLFSLQFSTLEFQKVTFFKSIEFCVFINTFINSIKSLE